MLSYHSHYIPRKGYYTFDTLLLVLAFLALLRIRSIEQSKQCNSGEMGKLVGYDRIPGYLAELGKKHVSRQRLCLPGMMEFWVNSGKGLPFFVITSEVNEKMIEMLECQIIPKLLICKLIQS